ncbi:ABC transporter ATP-binding protein [Pseudooceanicola algae]|uniref:Sulfate/thiosulfate import ATP-binding protein CysA n=1 Tax=Pseudooceanicola algae TaxID=1537215 RepID=A0A418SL65_9RHOB|nr:ABC transporter ATP-binding protein [Pseudooceanicola algae]QPM90840.1 Sulfate/thiosulfate import ATP-binding protein CysA [Pseudooceanicola algae]
MITIQSLRKSFGTTQILKGIDLDIAEGEFITLLGESGSGKSTLLRILSGLERADSGVLSCNGTVLDEAAKRTFVPTQARRFGFVFQDHALWPHMTIDENIAFPLRSDGWRKADMATRVQEVLAQVQMSAHAGKYPRQLSGGQRQRVGIARALALSPRVILLDEPLASLDSNLRDDLGHEIRKLARQFGLTCINVTHDRREAQILSDRIAVMVDGQIQQVGAPLKVFTRPSTVGIARFVNAGNIVPRDFLGNTPWTDDWLLLPRNALQIAPDRGEVTARVQDVVFIDGRFEVKVEVQGQDLTFFSETRPVDTGQVELNILRDNVVPLSA